MNRSDVEHTIGPASLHMLDQIAGQLVLRNQAKESGDAKASRQAEANVRQMTRRMHGTKYIASLEIVPRMGVDRERLEEIVKGDYSEVDSTIRQMIPDLSEIVLESGKNLSIQCAPETAPQVISLLEWAYPDVRFDTKKVDDPRVTLFEGFAASAPDQWISQM